jgi:hypothetical protein
MYDELAPAAPLPPHKLLLLLLLLLRLLLLLLLQNVITDARGTGLAQLMSRNPDPLGAFNGSLAYPNGAGYSSVFTLCMLSHSMTCSL